jgi:hypothetical protein
MLQWIARHNSDILGNDKQISSLQILEHTMDVSIPEHLSPYAHSPYNFKNKTTIGKE